jgi:hypothetical protein
MSAASMLRSKRGLTKTAGTKENDMGNPYEEGWLARRNWKELSDNPYHWNSYSYDLWFDGWKAHEAGKDLR